MEPKFPGNMQTSTECHKCKNSITQFRAADLEELTLQTVDYCIHDIQYMTKIPRKIMQPKLSGINLHIYRTYLCYMPKNLHNIPCTFLTVYAKVGHWTFIRAQCKKNYISDHSDQRHCHWSDLTSFTLTGLREVVLTIQKTKNKTKQIVWQVKNIIMYNK